MPKNTGSLHTHHPVLNARVHVASALREGGNIMLTMVVRWFSNWHFSKSSYEVLTASLPFSDTVPVAHRTGATA